MRRIFKLFVTLTLVAIIFTNSLFCFAADIGTAEDGIKAPTINYSQCSPLFDFEEFPNADFEQGFKYWQSDSGEYPSQVATLMEENGNHFVELNPGEAWNGISTVRFHIPEPQVGDSFVLLYDWRAEEGAEFDVTLIQWWIDKDNLHGHGIRMGFGNGTVVKKAEDGGFNTSMTIHNHQSLPPTRPNDIIPMYFSYALNLCGKAEKSVQIDNLRFCKYDKKTGTVYDLDGNVLYENVSNGGYTLKTFEEIPEKENPPIYDEFPEYSFEDKAAFFFEDHGTKILIAASILLVIIITVIVVIKVKKKKKRLDETPKEVEDEKETEEATKTETEKSEEESE